MGPEQSPSRSSKDQAGDISAKTGMDAVVEAKASVLTRAGFSEKQIEEIKATVPSLDVVFYKASGGESVDESSKSMVLLRDLTGKAVVCKFNSEILIAKPGDDAAAVAEPILGPIRQAEIERNKPENVAKRKAAQEARDAEAQKVYETLPEFFKKAIDEGKPGLYGRDGDIRIAKDAAAIVAKCPTPEAIEAFVKAGYEKQMAQVPELDPGHSGGSFGCVISLARGYVRAQQASA